MLTGLSNLAHAIETLATHKDLTVMALAGPPGCGKSTLSNRLCQLINVPCSVVPMDGFHLPNNQLIQMGCLSRKGAPETFDIQGLSSLLNDLKKGKTTHFPTFDRDSDSVIKNGGNLMANTQVILVEGNYLLFDQPGWRDLTTYWDASIWLEVPKKVLERRLIERWLAQGLSPNEAYERTHSNDMVNRHTIENNRLAATWTIAN